MFAHVLVLALIAGMLSGCSGSTKLPIQTYSASDRGVTTYKPNQGIPGVTLSFSGGFGITATDSEGRWSKDGLRGTVTVMPTSTEWSFAPPSP